MAGTVRHILAAFTSALCIGVADGHHVAVIASASANIGNDTLPSDLLFQLIRKHMIFTGTHISSITADSHVLCHARPASVEQPSTAPATSCPAQH